jgi:hypothetical protein
MDICIPLFTVEELNALDEKQLEILRHAVRAEILNEIRTNRDLHDILRGKLLESTYNQLRTQGRPRRARGPRPPPEAEPGSSE